MICFPNIKPKSVIRVKKNCLENKKNVYLHTQIKQNRTHTSHTKHIFTTVYIYHTI